MDQNQAEQGASASRLRHSPSPSQLSYTIQRKTNGKPSKGNGNTGTPRMASTPSAEVTGLAYVPWFGS